MDSLEQEYLGAAHGVTGIIYTLLRAHAVSSLTKEHLGRVRNTATLLLESFVQHDGNLVSKAASPVHRSHASEAACDSCNDCVQWCHGAVGLVVCMAQAWQVFGDEAMLMCAERAAELTWRQGLLIKGLGLCHGVAGNAYAFLCMHRTCLRRGDTDGAQKWLCRAQAYAKWMFASDSRCKQLIFTPDETMSLFEGLSGTLTFLLDLLHPSTAAFPCFE